MSQSNQARPNLLPGIVTDQPEIFESEPALSDDTGVNDLDLINDPTDDAIALIEVPIKQAFSYFAERESEIAKFYVQRHGEYKISGDKPDEETDVEKYHRLVSEVNQLLIKFQSDQSTQVKDRDTTLPGTALTSNLEILSRQLKALEFAAEDGSLDPTQSEFVSIKSKLERLKHKLFNEDEHASGLDKESSAVADETAKLIRMSALERRLNILESLIGSNDDKSQALLKSTKCDNLTDVAETLGSWASLFKPDNIQRVNRELDLINQRLEKLNDQVTSAEESKQIDPQNKAKLDQLYNLITASDKYRALVPTIIHRLNAMEELQQRAAQVVTTVTHLEQVQSQIVENLESNRGELTSLTKMFDKNIEYLKEFSKDIDSRINSIRDPNRD